MRKKLAAYFAGAFSWLAVVFGKMDRLIYKDRSMSESQRFGWSFVGIVGGLVVLCVGWDIARSALGNEGKLAKYFIGDFVLGFLGGLFLIGGFFLVPYGIYNAVNFKREMAARRRLKKDGITVL